MVGCSDESTKAYFGDKEQNRVVVVDVEKMKLTQEVPTGHQLTYTADKVYAMPKVYVVNRGSNAIDVVDTKTDELTKTIPLQHFPRSAEAMNKTFKLCEVSGMDKPMASIINARTDEVISTVGDNTKVDTHNNPNFGGSHATGHPFWLDTNHFVLLDRYHRKIITYYIEKKSNGTWASKKLNEIQTTSSVHQIIPSKGNYLGKKGYFYATTEGAPNIYPSLIKLKFIPNHGLFLKDTVTLKKSGLDVNKMYLHHGDFHPKKKLVYIPSGDGTLFIVNYAKMKIIKTLKVGKGAGHTVMIPDNDLAIVINHKDVFVSVIDLKTNKKIRDVRVSNSDELVGKEMIQAHPKYHVSKYGINFYAFITSEGKMYRLNLITLRVTGTVDIGGKPAQGSFVKLF